VENQTGARALRRRENGYPVLPHPKIEQTVRTKYLFKGRIREEQILKCGDLFGTSRLSTACHFFLPHALVGPSRQPTFTCLSHHVLGKYVAHKVLYLGRCALIPTVKAPAFNS
jgi:hypothetical protein